MTWVYDDANVDWEALSHLIKIAPLADKTAQHVKTTFSNSQFACYVYHEDVLVGAGRVLSDGLDVAYIADVVVHPDLQGQGLGKELMLKLLEFSKDHGKIILYANIGKEPFYAKLGFAKMNTAMAIFQNQEKALPDPVFRRWLS